MDHVVNILEGIAAAVIGTMLWIAALAKFFSPKIRITPMIIRGVSSDGTTTYRIQIENLARRSVIDLRFDCSLVFPHGDTTRSFVAREPGREPLIIPGKRHNQDHVFAMLLRSDLPERIAEYEGTWLRLRVFARDGVSSVGKVFSHEFHKPLDLIVDKMRGQNPAEGAVEDIAE
ncbi:hypothetical protein ABH920_002080 [Catenulispora sp. EB89]|uniref:hypothetical protein n=1 Tax=Catenulispora sp. EB89 TaxID=3156257 RepID=UPI0035165856